MSVRLADRSFQYPVGIDENMLVKVGKFTFPADFVILKMEEDSKVPLILGRPFLHIADAVIRVKQKQLNFGVRTEQMIFNIDSAMKHSYSNYDTCFSIDVIDEILEEDFDEVVKKETVKLLDTCIIYPIANSPWVSPIHCVPKKGGITVVTNENDELVPIRTITGWRVCIDYRKLNEAPAKDHFPLPFMDQMLERLAGNKYFCFLDGISGYFQIPIDPMDQEKKTFTCPFITYAYRRMPFGLCNAPATFQLCMLAIFHDMIEEPVKDKYHFMVKDGIVLGHKVSGAGLEVDKAKINLELSKSNIVKTYSLRSLTSQAKTLNTSQQKYTVTEKELMAVVFAFDKFRSYLILSKTIVHTDHSALKNMFKKQDAKPRLIRWILLLQGFDIEIKDRKGTKNVAADHLSQIENEEISDDSEVDDNFPGETLMEINTRNEPWFTDIANYLVADIILKGMTYQQKNKFFSTTSGRNPIFSKYVLTV
ncbi:DNA-directed DNA polymerase [Tanacetum coccineum]